MRKVQHWDSRNCDQREMGANALAHASAAPRDYGIVSVASCTFGESRLLFSIEISRVYADVLCLSCTLRLYHALDTSHPAGWLVVFLYSFFSKFVT
jgi:hypothetical protein